MVNFETYCCPSPGVTRRTHDGKRIAMSRQKDTGYMCNLGEGEDWDWTLGRIGVESCRAVCYH